MDDDSRIVSFAGNLNPTAQEFRPRFHHQQLHNHHHHHLPQLIQPTFFSPAQPPSLLIQPPSPPQQPQIYFPYAGGGVSYLNYSPPAQIPAYVSNTLHLQQQQQQQVPLNIAQTLSNPPSMQIPLVTASRSLLISPLPKLVSEATVRSELGVFGEIRAVQMERVFTEGILTVHFYDLRDAQVAVKEIRERHMEEQGRLRKHYNETQILAANYNLPPNRFDGCKRVAAAARGLICGEAVWAHFIVPMNCGGVVSDGNNQGTIVIFNLDSSISSSYLKQFFGAFGPVRELRETPSKRHQKFVEFYDIRDAAKALYEMNGKEMNGNNIVIEFSRPGGQSKRFFNSNSTPQPLLPPCQIAEASSSCCSTSQSSKKTKGKLEDALASLCVSDTGSVEGGIQNAGQRKSSKKISNANGNDNVKNQYKQPSKGKFKSYYSQFSMNEDAISESNSRDSRTTVMIKNIPNKYSQKLILNMLDNHCIHCNEQINDGDDQVASAYDFLYLPIDFNNKCNVGYGFVNMTSPEATLRLYKAFHQQSWEVFNSKKICQISYARVQGLEALKEHFKNSKFPNASEEIFPVVFTPPRDGNNLSQPIPLVGEPIINWISDEIMDGSDWTADKEGHHTNESDTVEDTVA